MSIVMKEHVSNVAQWHAFKSFWKTKEPYDTEENAFNVRLWLHGWYLLIASIEKNDMQNIAT